MKRFLLGIFALFSVVVGHSSGVWTLQGNQYQVDTLFHAYVGPGTTQTSLKLTGNSSLRIFYTTTDLTNKNVDVRGIKHTDRLVGVGTVSSALTSHSTATRSYFAGVNADFFGNSQPCGTTVIDGEIYNSYANPSWQHFAFNDARKPFVATALNFTGTVTAPGGASATINGVNVGRSTDALIVYNQRFGSTSGTNPYGTEVVLTPTSSENTMRPGVTVTMKVTGTPVGNVGSMAIPAGCYVLSGNGTSSTFVAGLKDGDIVNVTCGIALDGVNGGKVTQVLGGCPLIVSGGKVLETQSALDHLVALNPRTAVGFNADGTRLVMLVVDGRSSISAGVVSKVLADIMISTGCTEAMNFDGGGSSELYVRNFGVINAPSDGTERSVTDGLYLSTDAPQSDKTITEIRFLDAAMTLPQYGSYKPVIYGYNQYGVLVDKDVQGVVLSCESSLGTVSADGKTLMASGTGCHALTATYGGISAKIAVNVVAGEMKFRLSRVINDGYRSYKVETLASAGGIDAVVDNARLTWTSDDASIAGVDATGVVKGVADGTTTVHGKMGTFDGSLTVVVEKPAKHAIPVDAAMDMSKWTITQSGGTGRTVTVENGGIKIDFTGSSSRSNYIKLVRDTVLWSLPDSLRILINPGNVTVNSIKVGFRNNGSTLVTPSVTPALKANTVNVVNIATSSWCDVSDYNNFPILLSYIYLGTAASTSGTKYTLSFPAIETIYNAVPASSGISETVSGKSISVYPNPVERGENVQVLLPASVSEARAMLYNVGGQLIDARTLQVSGGRAILTTDKLQQGIYLLNVRTDAVASTVKFVVK